MRIPESELIINGDGSVFHIHLKPEELADNVILVGDPGRVDMIAELLEDIEFRHASREFVSITGRRNGKRITVLSHGIGPDNIDIVMTELDALANVDFASPGERRFRHPGSQARAQGPEHPAHRHLRRPARGYSPRLLHPLALFRGLRRGDELVCEP